VEIEAALEFVREHHRAVLATRRSDGSPQMSPVTCGLDPEGRVIVSSRETAMKTKNAARDAAVSIMVFTDAFFGQWIQVDGTVEVIRLPDAMERLVDYYRSISGEHPDWDEYRRVMGEERRVILAITPQRAGPDRAG
jgi:PPOX class probable F420-dependent enzyme